MKNTKKKASAVKVVVPKVAAPPAEPVKLLKLDLGCGTRKKEGFLGVDKTKFPGVDIIHDLTVAPWPFKDSSVEEVICSHFLEHLDHNRHNPERVKFMNELHRVLIPNGKACIVTPHWANNRAYGDFTHADKPVSEMFYFYLSKQWRKVEAPDNDIEWNPDGYKCDFASTWGYSMREDLMSRNEEYKMYALSNFKEAAYDLMATLTALK